MGIERKNLKIDYKERMATAIHETGHTLASYYTDGPEHIYKVIVNPRGGSLGTVLILLL
jgi:ATP-dependent Zn protease